MRSLDKAVDQIAKWTVDKTARNRALELLDGLVSDCKAAIAVWQDYLKRPGTSGNPLSFLSWTGPDVAKDLHEINIDARARLLEISDIAGTLGMGLDDDLIETAYRALKSGESATDAAKSSVTVMEKRINTLKELSAKIRKTTPSKRPATGAAKAAKKSSAKKTAPKKAAGKKAAKKKAAKTKKAKKAAKKAVKKAAKKAAKKKAAKKSAKKKPTKKAKKKSGKRK